MAHRQRWSLVGVVAEVTIRTSQGQFWLRPDPACNEIVEGVLGKALKKYPGVRLHAYDAQSNHLHYAVSTVEPGQLAPFKDFVHGNLARKVNRLRGRHGAFWSRRGAEIAIVDDDAQIARLRYILAQGPAAGLVASPTSWPGASSTSALLGNMRVSATYVSQDARRRNAKRKHPLPEAELAEDVSFELTPLPVWADLSPEQHRGKVAGLVEDVERAHETRPVLGVCGVLEQRPDAAPAEFQPSPMPLCHASSADSHRRFRAAYRRFREAYLEAARFARSNPGATLEELQSRYPPGSYIRFGAHVAAPKDFVPPWRTDPSDADAAC
ncbi:MAG: hypothetical protein KBG48_24580 [Kofleriaceae bacterium]|jgi:hypothetical protein|nr:hypothetical protein [Kofleriaceae bacterium]MBP9859764.1 hypothetical protein [Kofleriaceae bacterium]